MKKIHNKGEVFDYLVRETPRKTLQELAGELGVSRERVRQLQKDAGAHRPIKTLSQAMAEIRRLTGLLDGRQHDVVAG